MLYASHTLRSLMPGYYQCDLDIGEIFPNYLLHATLKRLSGVDVRHVRSGAEEDEDWEKSRKDVASNWECWTRNWMGLGDSPYRCIQWMVRLKMVAYGDPSDKGNPFHWTQVELNLPGSDTYRPHLPWVMKVRWDGHLAAKLFKYVGDVRVTAFCLELCLSAVQRFSSICAHLGIQDRAAKRAWPSTTPGPWAGTVCHTDGGEVSGCFSQEKWEKMQGLIRELTDMAARADRAAKTYRKGPRVVVWDPDLRRRAYRWEDGGRDAYKHFWEDTER